MANLLVTGGGGFIGSHTCLSLLKKGHKVVVIDSFIKSNHENLENMISYLKIDDMKVEKRFFIYECDIKNEKNLRKTFELVKNDNLEIDAIIHFAGLKDANESIIKPLDYWDNNVNGTINLLKIMNEFNCRTIVFSSSAAIYDATNNSNLISEESTKNPLTPYGRTKLVIEELLENVFNNSVEKWRIANLRYFNPIGANPEGIIGEDIFNSTSNIFPAILKAATRHNYELNIFGTNFNTKDGTGVRDYIHVADLADAHIAAFDYLKNLEREFVSLNIGTGIGTSVLELVDIFKKVNNCKIKTKNQEKRIGDLPKVVADNKRALELLNWEPKKSIEDMCIDGMRWISKNQNRLK